MHVLDPATRSRYDAEWRPLICRAAKGDMESFSRLYDLSSPVVYLVARLVLRDDVEAQEATLEAFEAVWCRAGEFEPSRDSASSWIARIASERALARRRLRSKATSGLPSASGDATSRLDSLPYQLRGVCAPA